MPLTSHASGRYVIALGSNRRSRHGSPAATLAAGLDAVGGVLAASPVIMTAPIGPSRRRFANQAAIIASDEPPPALLERLQSIEAAFGRRRGRRWGARVLDLDVILWSGGVWASPGLVIPHAAFRTRRFVLAPLVQIAPGWRDPLTGRTIRQLCAIDRKRRPA